VHIECRTAAADDKVGKVTTLVGPRKVNASTDAATDAVSLMASLGGEIYLMMWGGQLNVILEVGETEVVEGDSMRRDASTVRLGHPSAATQGYESGSPEVRLTQS
jgi:hypothetical protein